MRWRPHEDDEKERDRGESHRAGRRGPADHRREGTGGTANDDVLRRRALEPHRVDHGVEENGEGEKRCRHDIDEEAENQNRASRESEAEAQSLAGQDGTPRHRTVRGARHERIDVGVVPHIEGTRGAGTDRDCQKRHQRQPGMNVARCGDKTGKGREDDQRHHPRLEQGPIVLDGALTAQGGSARVGDIGLNVAHSCPSNRPRPPLSRRPRLSFTG